MPPGVGRTPVMEDDHMTLLQKIDQSATLMHRMAETVGADFGDALLEGRLTGENLRGAVLRCARCDAADFCETWLDVNASRKDASGITPDAPDFCANRDLMDRLRA